MVHLVFPALRTKRLVDTNGVQCKATSFRELSLIAPLTARASHIPTAKDNLTLF